MYSCACFCTISLVLLVSVSATKYLMCVCVWQNSVIEHNFGNDKHSVLMLNTSIPKNVSDMHLLRSSLSFFFSPQLVSL